MEDQPVKTLFPWYKEGLRFECTGCGKCCTGSPGYIWVTPEEIEAMSRFLDKSVKEFKRLYVKRRDNRFSLVEKKSENHSCVFFKDNKCQVYAARPLQCRAYPFWKENLTTPDSWRLTAQECEGVKEDAPLISFARIQQTLQEQDNE